MTTSKWPVLGNRRLGSEENDDGSERGTTRLLKKGRCRATATARTTMTTQATAASSQQPAAVPVGSPLGGRTRV